MGTKCYRLEKTFGWEKRLSDFIYSKEHTPYEISKHDCFLFLFGCVNAMTDWDLRPIFRNHYSSVEEGVQIINHYGGFSGFITTMLGISPRQKSTEVLWADNLIAGDLVHFRTYNQAEHMGVFIARSIAFPDKRGVSLLRNVKIENFWRI